MEINKHNYEAFFLLYTDNELNAEERQAVEDFVERYPGLKEELNVLLQTRLSAEERLPSFDKNLLYKAETIAEKINTANYELYFLLYADDELTEQERNQVEGFVTAHPDKKVELDLLLRVKIQPEEAIVFKNKAVLNRHEKPVISIAMQWRRMVAAASILLIGAWVWNNIGRIKAPFEPPVKGTEISAVKPVPQTKGASSTKTTSTVAIHKNESGPAENRNNTATALRNTTAVKEKKQFPDNTASEETAKPAMEKIPQEAESSIAKPDIKSTVPEPADLPVAINQAGAENKLSNALRPAVKPVILDQAAFNGKEEEESTNKNELAFLDTDNTERKSKGVFRGLFRKASRFVNRVTNAEDVEGKESIVRIASFEIAKK
ncbi:MAG: hypothetical protein KF746_17130 [Chitinophagaceae bacterium]|nr:hypothetical protein [Chitinophagaceae bacterium]